MKLNQYIDHTLLKANATKVQILQLCQEAKDYEFASVCVNPGWVSTCKQALLGSDVKVCTVIGFPLGATSSKAKAMETQIALADGADEFDMVINLGFLKDKDDAAVVRDIAGVVEAAQGKVVKVIIEACLLSEEEKVRAALLCADAKATFVKTSTGFSTGGATVEDVKLLKETLQGRCFIKAAGGVRTTDDLLQMIAAGADRIGTSGGIALVGQSGTNENSY